MVNGGMSFEACPGYQLQVWESLETWYEKEVLKGTKEWAKIQLGVKGRNLREEKGHWHQRSEGSASR